MLLQEIYAREAMQDAGITGDLSIVHAEQPQTIVNGKDYGLLFPKRLFTFGNKTIEKLFIGLKTPTREALLSKIDDCTVIYSERGRNEQLKGYDEVYYSMMSSARRIVCPDGDFVWTYRFFEAVACGCIPVVEHLHPMYEGFIFEMIDMQQPNRWDMSIINHNRELLMERHTL